MTADTVAPVTGDELAMIAAAGVTSIDQARNMLAVAEQLIPFYGGTRAHHLAVLIECIAAETDTP